MSDEFDVNNTDINSTDGNGSDRPGTENHGMNRTGMGGVYSSNRFNRNDSDSGNTEGTTSGATSGNTEFTLPETPTYGSYTNANSSEHYAGGEKSHESSENREYRYSYQRIPEEPKKKERKPKKEHSKVWGRIAGVIGLGIIFGLTAGVTLYFMDSLRSKSAEPKVFEEIEDDEIALPETESESGDDIDVSGTSGDTEGTVTTYSAIDVSDVAEDVMPAVVSIINDYTVTERSFFGTYSREASGSGSGIIIGKDEDTLYIGTNNHVVDGADKLSVSFIDGSEAEARIKGTNSEIDLAVILVDLSDLSSDTKNAIKVAKLGNSDGLKVGEPAIAIGNALGYGQSVTVGVISAVDRTLDMEDGSTAEGLIQTDAAINPGNSGGALLNMAGEVIGINSSKIGGSAIDGVGFAIPISSAEPILSNIASGEEKTKVASGKTGYLGIGGVTVTSDVSQMYGMPVGVAVRQVYSGTGAERAGLMPGDVIVAINSETIDTMEELRDILDYYEAGSTVTIDVYRIKDGEYVKDSVDVELVSKQELDSVSSGNN